MIFEKKIREAEAHNCLEEKIKHRSMSEFKDNPRLSPNFNALKP